MTSSYEYFYTVDIFITHIVLLRKAIVLQRCISIPLHHTTRL